MCDDNDDGYNNRYDSTPPLVPLSHERIYDNNPHENPRFMEKGTTDDNWHYTTVTTTIKQDELSKSNTNKESN